jgi:hypothetical protein
MVFLLVGILSITALVGLYIFASEEEDFDSVEQM